MATQRLIPGRGLSLSIPTGDGRQELVDLPTEGIHPALLVANEKSPVNAASYRKVADQLLGVDWWSPRRIFVTSPTGGDGKTCTAFSLAWALNMRGASVLLVELNFARPRFSSFLGGLQIRFGVDCAIRRLAHPADCVISMGSEMLGVSAVKNAMRMSEFKQHLPLLASYLEWGSDNFDWLILDCPPVLSVAWNKWFREYARPALLVVRELHTPAVQVRQAINRLGAGLKGVLLNDVVNADTSKQESDSDG
jgi:Mrp family chromosome partitioning ATPase